MPSEADRLDLYNGLSDLLGPERAETLMASLPALDISSLATKADLEALATKADLKVLEVRMDGLETRMTSLEAGVIGLGLRLDRMFLALVAGLFVVVAAMVGVIVSV